MTTAAPRLRIAYLSTEDPLDRRSWSGTMYHMARTLQKHCGEVTFLGPLEISQLGGKLQNRLLRAISGKRYDYSHSISYAVKCARLSEVRLGSGSYDLIFAPVASNALAFLHTKLPVVYASDTTFTLLHDYYPEFSNLAAQSVREGNIVELAAITSARIALFSSEWAARSAISDYGAHPDRVRVVPFGANFEAPPAGKSHERGSSRKIRLLFPAVSWHRKGGDIAFGTLLALLERGIDAELVVCGCRPPTGLRHERMIVTPFLDKNDPAQGQALCELFLGSDLLLLPTRHDCTPIVLCEACSCGLPVIASDTGGIASIIKNGVNGILLPPSATAAEYAALIAGLAGDEQRYRELSRQSRLSYDERLNWDAWGRSVRAIFDEIVRPATTHHG